MTNYKVGQKVVITERLYGHDFEIGQIVKLLFYDISNGEWEASDGNDAWYLREEEFSDAGILYSRLDKHLVEPDETLLALEEQDRIVDYLSATLAKELEKQKQMRITAAE
jgi:hypothetical protein